MLTLAGSAVYAFAFTRIYTRPHTRVNATGWIYDHISGPVNLVSRTDDGEVIQQAPYRSGDTLFGAQSKPFTFVSWVDGELEAFTLPTAQFLGAQGGSNRFSVIITRAGAGSPSHRPYFPRQPIRACLTTAPACSRFGSTRQFRLKKAPGMYSACVSRILTPRFPSARAESQHPNRQGASSSQSLNRIVETITPTHACWIPAC